MVITLSVWYTALRATTRLKINTTNNNIQKFAHYKRLNYKTSLVKTKRARSRRSSAQTEDPPTWLSTVQEKQLRKAEKTSKLLLESSRSLHHRVPSDVPPLLLPLGLIGKYCGPETKAREPYCPCLVSWPRAPPSHPSCARFESTGGAEPLHPAHQTLCGSLVVDTWLTRGLTSGTQSLDLRSGEPQDLASRVH